MKHRSLPTVMLLPQPSVVCLGSATDGELDTGSVGGEKQESANIFFVKDQIVGRDLTLTVSVPST